MNEPLTRRDLRNVYLYIGMIWLAILGIVTPMAWNAFVRATNQEVFARWRGDDLVITSMTGPREIYHLWGRSENQPVAARLPEPLFAIDSESTRIPYSTIQKLTWKAEGGQILAVPVKGSEIVPLFRRFEFGTFRKD